MNDLDESREGVELTVTPQASTNTQDQDGDSSDEIEAEISRLENADDVDTDEDGDSENPNYEPGHHEAQLLSQTDHFDTTIDEDNNATLHSTNQQPKKQSNLQQKQQRISLSKSQIDLFDLMYQNFQKD